jgi:predicted TIM-barrel fold metal-dependent hydrolase
MSPREVVARAERTPSHREPDRAPVLPFLPGEVGNGEFVPGPPTARDRWIVRETLARSERAAAAVGMERRRFLQSVGGMAAMLAVVNACASGGDGSAAPSTAPGTSAGSSSTTSSVTTTGPGGTYEVPPATELEACAAELGSQGEFIVDIHTHHVMPDAPWRQIAPEIEAMLAPLAPGTCTEADPLRCLDRQAYVRDIFLGSDTAVTMLSDVPNSGDGDAPVPFADKITTYDFVASLSEPGRPRALVHSVIAPNFGPLQQSLDEMTRQVETAKVAAFKFYSAWGPGQQGYELDDPAIGIPVIEHARSLGVNVIAGHKGLPIVGFDFNHNGPRDLVALASRYPDMDFVVFHSAFERATIEAPYDPSQARTGINSMIKAMDDLGVAPNSNVWADLGTGWREVMGDPTAAAHMVGKLLARVGEDRVLWGTDAVWFGSPQPQIMAFRAFQITPEFQDRFGYPALTPEIKAKVLGLNAAALLNLDPTDRWCGIDAARFEAAKATYAGMHDAGELVDPWRPQGPLTRRQVLSWLRREPAYTPF